MYFNLEFADFLEPDFPINYIYDVSNYGILIGLLFIFIKVCTTLKERSIFFYSLLMLSPFLFNGFLIDWYSFPDQSKYLGTSRELRETFFDFDNTLEIYNYNINGNVLYNRAKVNLPSFFYSLFPTTNFETYRSIGFINRFLYIIMIILLIDKKNIPFLIKLFLIFSPSLALYSSISLRETLILVLMVFLFYSLLNKNYLNIIISIPFLLLIKEQNVLIVLMPLLLYSIYDRKKNKILITIILCLILLLITLFFEEQIFLKLNKVSYGFFSEHYGGYKGLYLKDAFETYTLENIISKIYTGAFKLIISPYPNINSLFISIIFFENLLIFYLIYTNLFLKFSKKNELEKKISIYWIVTLIFSILIYSIIAFNDGTIHRYKIIIMSFVLIGFNIHLTNKKHLNRSLRINYSKK